MKDDLPVHPGRLGKEIDGDALGPLLVDIEQGRVKIKPDGKTFAGEHWIPLTVAHCKRCRGSLRAINPRAGLQLVVCDRCEVGTVAPRVVEQYLEEGIAKAQEK